MTAKEAIGILTVAKTEMEWSAPLDYQEAFNVAIVALEKQIPKPFIWEGGNPVCPVCDEEVWDMAWCNCCGQRLDRDVEECGSDEVN